MATLQEQSVEWLPGLKSMQDDPAFFEQALSFVQTIPLNPAGMAYCSACENFRGEYVATVICSTLFLSHVLSAR